jgi:hypothetical protein
MAAPILRARELRDVESRFAGNKPSLMERAGKSVADTARRLAPDTGAPILVVAGPGNNGGDAWVAAAHLREAFPPRDRPRRGWRAAQGAPSPRPHAEPSLPAAARWSCSGPRPSLRSWSTAFWASASRATWTAPYARSSRG